MRYSLDIAALPEGYGEALLPLAIAKAHLRIEDDDEDALVGAMRDVALSMVESHTSLILGPRAGQHALTWRTESLPGADRPISLGVRPVTAIAAVTYLDVDGGEQSIDPASLRIFDDSCVRPVAGVTWPARISGGVTFTFEAGLAANTAPKALLAAAQLCLGTLFQTRESVTPGTIVAELPLGFTYLCRPYRRLSL